MEAPKTGFRQNKIIHSVQAKPMVIMNARVPPVCHAANSSLTLSRWLHGTGRTS